MASKWIIHRGTFKMANVSFHKELLGSKMKDKEERALVKGGGYFKFNEDEEKTTFELFGKSFDFGSCQLEDFKEVVHWPRRHKDHIFYFTDEHTGIRTRVK